MYSRTNHSNNGFQTTNNGKRGYRNEQFNKYEDLSLFDKTVKKPIRRHKQSTLFSKMAKKLIHEDRSVNYLQNEKDTASDYERILAKDPTELLDKFVYSNSFQNMQEQRLNDYLKTTTVINREKGKFMKNFIENEFPMIFEVNHKVNKHWRDSFAEDQLLIHKLYERCNAKQHCGVNLKPYICATNVHDTIFFSLDLEEFENSGKITEVGITIYDPRENGFNDKNGLYHNSINPHFRTYHIIIKERISQRNKKFIFCKKQESLFNETYILDFKNTHSFLQTLWDRYFNNTTLVQNGFKVALVGQSVMGDVKSLRSEFNLEENFEFDSQLINTVGMVKPRNINKRSKAPKTVVSVYDTEKLSRIMMSDSYSVKKQLRFLNIPHTSLHNALNDSYYTLLAFISMTDIDTRINMKLDDPVEIFKKCSHLQLLTEHKSKVIPLEIAYLLEKEEQVELYGKVEENKSTKKLNKLTQQLEFGLPLDIDTYLDIPY